MHKRLLLIGGVLNFGFGLLHLGLGTALNWNETLSCLNLDNRATVYTLNVHLAFTCLAFAYLSLFQRKDILTTKVGQAAIAAIGLFWVLRALNQVVFYGLSAPDTPFWVVVCLIVSSFYLIPIVWKRPATLEPVHSEGETS